MTSQHNLNFLKIQAKKLKKELGIPHVEALNNIAQKHGYSNWIHCQKLLNTKNTGLSTQINLIAFTNWLKKQKNRNSPLGDLARDMISDSTWPFYDTFEDYENYLDSRNANKNVIDTLKKAWKSYKSNQKRSLLPKQIIIKPRKKMRKDDPRRIVFVKNAKTIDLNNRKAEKFGVGDKAWISWDGRKAIPVTITEVTELHYSFIIEKPLKNYGNEHFLFLDEVCSTPELACSNRVTL